MSVRRTWGLHSTVLLHFCVDASDWNHPSPRDRPPGRELTSHEGCSVPSTGLWYIAHGQTGLDPNDPQRRILISSLDRLGRQHAYHQLHHEPEPRRLGGHGTPRAPLYHSLPARPEQAALVAVVVVVPGVRACLTALKGRCDCCMFQVALHPAGPGTGRSTCCIHRCEIWTPKSIRMPKERGRLADQPHHAP